MAEYRRQIVTTSVVAIVLALSIGIGIYYLQPQLGETGTTRTSTTLYPASLKTTNSTLGLALELSLNSTIIDPSSSSHAISVNVSVYNVLSHVNNLSAAYQWPIKNLSAGSCNYELPFGIAVFKGYYTMANISSQLASSMPLFPTLPCPLEISPANYAFQPNSYYATIVGKPELTSTSPFTNTTTTRETLVQQPMSDNIPLSGYCCTQIPINGGFTTGSIPFAVGNYTLVAGDMWGQLVILHFVVSSKQTTSSSSSVQIETVTTATCTNIPAISYLYCPSPLRISAVGIPGATPSGCPAPCGSWNFTATINSTSVARGQSILLWANLTNLGPNETFGQWIGPYINPKVADSSGVKLWAWDPPAVTFGNFTVTSGETISQKVDIPTSVLIPGQSYFISVAPLSLKFPTPNNYTFTFEFSVT